jgi:cell division transport system permease protein
MAGSKKQDGKKAPEVSVRPQRQTGRPKKPARKPAPKSKSAPKGDAAKLRPSAAIVPPQSVAGRALTLVVAIMSFLACLTVGAVSIVWDAADAWQNDLVREITIQIRPTEGVDMLREIDKAVALAQEFSGIDKRCVRSPIPKQRLSLEPWLGDGLQLDGLPVPRLIQITIADPSLLNLEQLRATIRPGM